MIWPQSLDINAIELLLDELDKRIHKACSTSATDFWHILQTVDQYLSPFRIIILFLLI